MGDPALLPARDAAARIAGGTLGIEELVRAYLARIAEREAAVGAWEHLDPEQGLAEARRHDRAVSTGALCGIPFSIKDVIDTHDMPTGHGSPIYRGNRPAGDAACVALARGAGAIALGKTVTAEFAALQPGRTTNPWNRAHTPGGSSSGSAAAVAAGMVPLALGTQSAGSIVRPAAYCGVVGYKPSFGMIPRSGVKPLADSFDTVGVFARDARTPPSSPRSWRSGLICASASRSARRASRCTVRLNGRASILPPWRSWKTCCCVSPAPARWRANEPPWPSMRGWSPRS